MKRSTLRADSRRGFLKFLAIGCGVIVLIGVLGIFMVVKNVNKIAAAGVESLFTAMVDSSPMPADQKQKMIVEIKSLANDVRDKKIGIEEFNEIMQAFVNGPLLKITLVTGAVLQYLETAQVPEAEQKTAELNLQRFIRGVVEEKIKDDQLQPVLDIAVSTQPGKEYEIQKLNDAQGKELLELLAKIADEAAIPNEPYQVDYAAEFKKLIDRGMGREVLDDAASFEGETEPAESLDRPESVGQESLDLKEEKEFPAEAPAN